MPKADEISDYEPYMSLVKTEKTKDEVSIKKLDKELVYNF